MKLTNLVVYGRLEPVCSYCVSAKQLLDSKGVTYIYKDINDTGVKDEMIELLATKGIVPRSIPQIISDECYVGGYQELRNVLT